MPHVGDQTKLASGFSLRKAQKHVNKIGAKPHSIGTKQHSLVRNYIVDHLQQMGLEVQTQKGYYLSKFGTFTAPENIITKIPGTNPQPGSDLLLLTHYDSAVHSSPGASDAGSGIAVILESLRVFLAKEEKFKNNIIICFTDAEEIGLNGAGLFVKEHAWVRDIGLVLNFEARGSGGPSNTILETNAGNTKLIQAFAKAEIPFSNATSLMYSVYKKLPNDTDSTIFREEENIPGFFFAFIDDHYDYHTANDTPQNLDKNSLAHQATYLMGALPHFANLDLSNLRSVDEEVYFNFPLVNFVHYSYYWILPLLLLAWLLFIGLIFYAFRKKRLNGKYVAKSFIPFLASLLISGFLAFFGIRFIWYLYPQYQENLNGFTVNGHDYIAAFVALSFAVLFYVYSYKIKKRYRPSLLVAPLFIWLLLNTVLAVFLKGASYFILPVYFSLIAFFFSVKQGQPNLFFMLLLSAPAIFIFAPLIQFFPVGLGLKMLVISAILCVLVFGLLLPIFNAFKIKKILAGLALLIAVFYFGKAHLSASFSKDNKKPNSLLYLYDKEENSASWLTYDKMPDNWTGSYIKEAQKADLGAIFHSKYQNTFTYSSPAPISNIPLADFSVQIDSSQKDFNHFRIQIKPRREINRMEFFLDRQIEVKQLSLNGKKPPALNLDKVAPTYFYNHRKNDRLFTYYAVDKDVLEIELQLTKDRFPKLEFYAASNNLLQNKWFNVKPRQKNMMPKPFVLNDAIITKQTINLQAYE